MILARKLRVLSMLAFADDPAARLAARAILTELGHDAMFREVFPREKRPAGQTRESLPAGPRQPV